MSVLVLGTHEVEAALGMRECIAAMERLLGQLARGELHQPLRQIISPPGTDTLFAVMPSHRGGERSLYGLKELVIAPGNPARGLDSHQGGVLLHDGETGELIALLNASPVTAIRTAAVSAVATRALARRDARRVAIIGAGVQARAHVEAMRAVLDAPEIRVASRSPASAERLAEELGVTAAAGVEDAVRDADVVCTVTTATEPVIDRAWLSPGVHVNAVGSASPKARELDTATVRDASLFVDRRESALAEAGDVVLAIGEGAIGEDHIRADLGEVLIGSHPGRQRDDELTIFESLGIAAEDLAAAELAVTTARAKGIGTEVDF